MAERPLGADEAALWARVLATVRPLPGRKAPPVPAGQPAKPAAPVVPTPRAEPRPAVKPSPARVVGTTLDASWDRRLSRGLAAPDFTVDLHGHTLATAYARLDGALEQAIASGARVVLLVTGKPPRPESERPHARGAIRDAVGDWIAASRHAGAIAAVRNAHPRHGGSGALYIVLRRPRAPA
ncbi:MAG: Smr/MutS family protein [Sphingomonas sp.]